MSDFKKLFQDALAPIPATDAPKVKLNPRAFLSRSGLDTDEKEAIEEASESQEVSEAFMVWATKNARFVHDAVRNDSSLGGTDIALIWELRKILARMIDESAERERETNEGDLYEEHA